MLKNTKLYEINTRVWINRFGVISDGDGQRQLKLNEIPLSTWDYIAEKGIDAVWLMGIWKTNYSTVDKYCFKDYLVRSYDKALKDWKHKDIIGSPYAIDRYEVNPALGDFESLIVLKKTLNERGIKLFLDFVPNHFSSESSLIKTHPEIFLKADEEIFKRDSYTYFKPEGSDVYFAHGRDPFFPAWDDTAQINYFSPEAVEFMTDTLTTIAEYCDGVRCDMAMLILDNVFYNTWRGPLNKFGFTRPAVSFWKHAIRTVKEKYPGFVFIAEAYWDLEWDLQQLGFDYTYDKRLTDRIISGTAEDIGLHLRADIGFQQKSVRFIENHDEDRAVAALGKNQSMAAAVIISTIPGMRFYFDGQFEGKRVKLPVQLGREPEEPVIHCVSDFYNKLLNITRQDIFQYGDWTLLQPLQSWDNNFTCHNIISWLWSYKQKNCIVAVNYSGENSQCRLKFDINGYEDSFKLKDVLNGAEYIRNCEEVYHQGLYIDLKPWHSHIFFF